MLASREYWRNVVKYFFLADGWTIGRVWELGGLWNEAAWRRKPWIERTALAMNEQQQRLWLYRVEESVLMVEVKPSEAVANATHVIGQVVLKRLMTADQAIDLLASPGARLENHVASQAE
jgi:hypothetical protein